MRLMTFSLMTLVCCSVANAQGGAEADKDRQIASLKRQLEMARTQQLTINSALAASKKSEAKSLESLRQLTNRLQALGMHEGDVAERLLQAVADAQALDKELRKLRDVSDTAQQAFRLYLKGGDDEVSRQKVEVALRRLDLALFGGVNQPAAQAKGGNLQSSKVMSIDSKSGMLVLNMGAKVQVKVGVQLIIKRGGRVIGEAIVVEVRPNLCGALMVSRVNEGEVVRVGDKAHAKLQR